MLFKTSENGEPSTFRKFLNAMSFTQFLIFGYSLIVLVGGIVLMLPISSTDRVFTPLHKCIFTTTSALSGTGLTLFDTYTYWSFFGQIIILLIIQVGGIGFMSMAIFALAHTSKKIGLKQRAAMRESVGGQSSGGMVKFTSFMLRGTIFFEGLGTFALCFYFVPKCGWGKGIFFALFHSISAFCTAGIDLMGYFEPNSSLCSDGGNLLLSLPIIILLVIGGIGFFTWTDMWENRNHVKRYSAQTKIILLITVLFYIVGMADMLLIEWNGSLSDFTTGGQKLVASSMLMTSGRDAGFASVAVTRLKPTTILLLICFMFIGGSPGSTACGIRTTTFAVMVLTIVSVFKRKKTVECFGRRIPDDTVRNACCITTLYLVIVTIGTMIITAVDGFQLTPVVFELVSAISSTGLSMGITTSLSDLSIVIVIFIMFFGRVGGITFIMSLHRNMGTISKGQLPEERIMLG